MTDEQKDKIIAEALGLCWHEWNFYSGFSLDAEESDNKCTKCNKWESEESNPDFSTWPGFGLIMTEGQKRGWWTSFLNYLWQKYYWPSNRPGPSIRDLSTTPIYVNPSIPLIYVNPPIMRDELASWLSEHEAEWRGK